MARSDKINLINNKVILFDFGGVGSYGVVDSRERLQEV